MEQLGIVIVNWNTGSLLASCLEALHDIPDRDLIGRIVILDNHSSDDSFDRAKHFMKRAVAKGNALAVQFIDLDTNEGFARANNRGIQIIRDELGTNAHILLLNPDTEVLPRALERMVSVFKERPQAGVIGPKLLEADKTVQQSVRRFPTLGVLLMYFFKLHRLFPRNGIITTYLMKDFQYDDERAVDQVMGAAFLIRNTTIDTVGVLDDAYWIWFEEVDYCKRAADAGLETVFTPHAQVLHHGGVSFGKKIGFAKSMPFYASALTYARKHLGIVPWFILVACLPFALLLVIPASFHHLSVKRNQEKQYE